MLIQALCEYYDILARDNKVSPAGYTKQKITYLICLTSDGKVDEIIDLRKQTVITNKNGKTKIDYEQREEVIPERSQKTSIDLNIIEHRPLYIFGLNYDKGELTPKDPTNKAVKSHEVFVKGNLEFIDGLDSPVINAYREFLINWVPEHETKNSHLLTLGKEYSSSYYAFCLSGNIYNMLHKEPLIKERWEMHLNSNITESENEKNQCTVFGKELPISRIHDKIKGIKGGQAAGTVMIGFNNSSESSYGKEQSFNSNISVNAMKKYTEALNLLLEDPLHRTYIDDMTIVHWAQTVENADYDILLRWMTFDEKLDSQELDHELKGVYEHAINGIKSNYEILKINNNTEYYIVGMTPNNSRIAVKFIYKDKFGNIIKNVAQHQKDISILENSSQIPLWRLNNELISPKSSNESVPPALITDIFHAIFLGTDYPEQLLSTVVRRIKTDSDTDQNKFAKFNAIRVGIIKGCINRRARIHKKEGEITMALDLKNTNSAYLCGRLFAILEKVQQKASNDSLNKTIRDSYFASACSTPAVVLPRLLMLAQNHLAKLDYEKYWSSLIGEVINMLSGEFPNTLNLTEQGMFIIGYYQQFYSKKEKNDKMEDENDGSN